MRQKAKKIFTIFMVLTVLVSSHAFAYYEHICLITKQKTYSIDPETCAGKFIPKESKTPEIKRPTCCELNLKVQKVDDGQQNHLKIPVFVAFEGLFELPIFVFSILVFDETKTSNFAFGNSSPPKPKLFILHDQFLI